MPAIDADLQAAYLYTFPYYEMARTRCLVVDFPLNPQRGAVNTLLHRRTLADHCTRGGSQGADGAIDLVVQPALVGRIPVARPCARRAAVDDRGQ